jgi:ribonuclease HI
MKKKLFRYLTEIDKALGDTSPRDAISQIEAAISNLIDKEVISNGNNDFVIPKEMQNVENGYVLYSDGACRGNPGPGSYGCFVQDTNGHIVFEHAEVFEHTTNNRMELLGVINGLKVLGQNLNDKGTSISDIKVLAVTDSKYVVDGITKWVDGWKKRGWKKADKKPPENVELWKQLDLLKEKVGTINFAWVKGHSGHAQNEHCDQLANAALDNDGY